MKLNQWGSYSPLICDKVEKILFPKVFKSNYPERDLAIIKFRISETKVSIYLIRALFNCEIHICILEKITLEDLRTKWRGHFTKGNKLRIFGLSCGKSIIINLCSWDHKTDYRVEKLKLYFLDTLPTSPFILIFKKR